MTHPNRRQTMLLGLGALALPLAGGKASAASHAVHVVEIENFKFSPATLQMEAGDKVQFINRDSAPHTATADNGAFDTGRLRRGQDATVESKAAGEYSYICAIHPRMKGTIVAS